MTNPFYTASGTPGTLSFGASQPVRSEFQAIQGGFDKFPDFTAAAPGTFLINNFTSTGITTAPGMFITPAGNLGIGTPSPSHQLDVFRNQNAGTQIGVINPNTGSTAYTAYYQSNGTNGMSLVMTGTGYSQTMTYDLADIVWLYAGGLNGLSLIAGAAAPLRFYTSTTERMRIGAEGNVSIGTTTTLVPLTVLGTGDGSFFNATIVARAPNNPKYGYYASADGFQWSTRVTPGGGNWALRYENGAIDPITVDRSGNVGIGKVPTRILDIQQDQAGTSVVALTNNAASGPAACSIQANTAGASAVFGALGPTFGGNPFIPGVSGNNQAFLESGGSSSFYIGAHPAVPMIFGVNRVERMRIDPAGNVGIGTANPSNILDVTANTNAFSAARVSNVNAGANVATGWQLFNGSSTSALYLFGYNMVIGGLPIARADGMFLTAQGVGGLTLATQANQPIYFAVNSLECARFDNPGAGQTFLRVSNNGTYIGLGGGGHELTGTVNNSLMGRFYNTASPNPYGFIISYPNYAPNDSGYFGQYLDSSLTRFYFFNNGGMSNFSANNGNLSDARLKGQPRHYDGQELDALERAYLKVAWGKWKFLDQTHDDWNHGPTAQDIEDAFYDIAPELVDEIDISPRQGPQDTKTIAIMRKVIYETDLTNISRALLAKVMKDVAMLKTYLPRA